MLPVWVPTSVSVPSRTARGSDTTQRPSAPTVASHSPVEPDALRATVAPGCPSPATVPVEVLRVASVGGVTTSDEGVAADPSDGAVRSVTVKTCAGPDTTVPRHDHVPSRCTWVEQVAVDPEATRSV